MVTPDPVTEIKKVSGGFEEAIEECSLNGKQKFHHPTKDGPSIWSNKKRKAKRTRQRNARRINRR